MQSRGLIGNPNFGVRVHHFWNKICRPDSWLRHFLRPILYGRGALGDFLKEFIDCLEIVMHWMLHMLNCINLPIQLPKRRKSNKILQNYSKISRAINFLLFVLLFIFCVDASKIGKLIQFLDARYWKPFVSPILFFLWLIWDLILIQSAYLKLI